MLHRDEFEGRGYPSSMEGVQTNAQFKRGLLFLLLLIVGIIAGVTQSWAILVLGSMSSLTFFAVLSLLTSDEADK